MRQKELEGRQFKIKKSSIITYLLVLCLFLPSNIGSAGVIGSFFQLMNNISALYIAIIIMGRVLKNHSIPVKNGEFLLAFIGFMTVRVVAIYINHGIYNTHDWIAFFKQIFAICYIFYYFMQYDSVEDKISPILAALWTWIMLDTIITILYPQGMPALGGGYLLGWKNNKLTALLAANLLSLYKYNLITEATRKYRFFCFWFVLAFFGILNAFLVESSTTCFVILVFCVMPFLPDFIKKSKLYNTWVFLIIHLILWYVMVGGLGKSEVLNAVSQELFHKDATFTGRVFVWESAFLLIKQRPIWGYGKYGFFRAVNGYMWGTAHNQILEMLIEGGIIQLLAWCILFLVSIWNSRKCINAFQRGAATAMFLFSFGLLTEATSGDLMSWLILFLIWWGGKIESVHEYYNRLKG